MRVENFQKVEVLEFLVMIVKIHKFRVMYGDIFYY